MAFYEYQGCLQALSPSYVERQADHDLVAALEAGEFCQVPTPRQMGKSSLVAHAAERLRARGHFVAVLDLTVPGKYLTLTAEQWYDGLIIQVGRQLGLEGLVEDYWLDHERLGPAQRFFSAIYDVVLPHLGLTGDSGSRLIVFVDEIDVVGSLPFEADEFFAAIRECYNARVTDARCTRVSFCVLGLTGQAGLLHDPALTPFLTGCSIQLDDFTREEASVLGRGLNHPEPVVQALLGRVFDWTHGHPYLTQRLCQRLAEQGHVREPAGVDALVEELFLRPGRLEEEPNLSAVRAYLAGAGRHRAEVLRIYGRILQGEGVPDDESLEPVNVLRLSGLVRSECGVLVVRNRIYAGVFDARWLREQGAEASAAPTPTLAVLPFVDLSAESSAQLCDGLTEELIRVLGHVAGFKVVSRDSVFQFKGRAMSHRDIGLRLGAELVLEGSVRRLGTRLRVTADLVDAARGVRLWSGSFRHGTHEWRMAQEHVARAVTHKLVECLGTTTEDTRFLRQKARDTEAYNLYLRGISQGSYRTEAALRRSLTYLQSSLALDPQFAPAWAGLSDTYILLGIYNFWPPNLTYPRAIEAATKAVELDEGLAQAHNALACAGAIFDRDLARAEKEFRRAIKLNPSYALAHQWLSIMCLSPAGRHKESLDHLQMALDLDPLSISIPTSTGLALHLAGRYEAALDQCRSTIEMDEDFWLPQLFLGWAAEQAGRLEEARTALEMAALLSHNDPNVLSSIAHLEAKTGSRTQARDQLERLLALAESRYVPAAEIAMVYGALGDLENARSWLGKAGEDHSFRLVYAQVDPRFEPLRADPACAAVMCGSR